MSAEYRLVAVPDVVLPDGTVRQWTIYQSILHNRLSKVYEEAGLLARIVKEGNRCFTPSEQACWSYLMSVIIELNQRIARLQERG